MSKLAGVLQNSLLKYKKKTLVSLKKDFVYDRYTYGQIYDYSLRFISLLKQNNIKKGDRIAICSYNCPQYFYTFLGCIFSGVIIVPIDYGSSPKLVRKFMEKTECKLLITSKNKIIRTKIKKIFVEDLDDILKTRKQGNINKNLREHDLVQILYTSGTTGEPKGVMLSHENIYTNTTSALTRIVINKNYQLLSLIPLSHVFEQVAGFFGVIFSGAKTTQLKSRRPSEMVKVMQNEKVNGIITVPAFFILFQKKIEERAKKAGNYRKLQKTLKFSRKFPFFIRKLIFKKIHKVFGNKLEKVVCGAAPLPLETELFWENIGVRVVKGYGLTETSPVLTVSNERKNILGSAGQAIPGVRLRLNEKKEIWALGRNTTPGYYKNKKATEKLYHGRWLRTGDLGEFDDKGNLFIKGRLKNMILKPSGLNVYPEDIEKALDKNPEIKESCVLGISHGQDIITTAVLLLEEKIPNKEVKKIISETNKSLEFHQKIQDHIVWKKKDFPRTLTLKVKRRDVESEVKKKTYLHTESEDELIQILAKLSYLNSNEIKENSKLFCDLGFDSLKVIVLSTYIEEKMRVEIDEYLINADTTVKNLRDLISQGVDQSKRLKLNEIMFSPIFYPLKILISEIAYFSASRFYTSVNVKGRENLKKIKTQFILTPNHASHLDFPTMARFLPIRHRVRMGMGAAADYFFKTGSLKSEIISRSFSYCLGGFPLSRIKKGRSDSSIKQSFEFIGKIIDRGWSVALSPEGTRSTTGKINKFKPGIGIIVKESRLPVIPVKLKGLHEILPPHSRWPKKRGPVEIIFGKPIYYSSDMSAVEITKHLENTMRKM